MAAGLARAVGILDWARTAGVHQPLGQRAMADHPRLQAHAAVDGRIHSARLTIHFRGAPGGNS